MSEIGRNFDCKPRRKHSIECEDDIPVGEMALELRLHAENPTVRSPQPPAAANQQVVQPHRRKG